MAAGSGKTFAAITAVIRLLKYAKAKRILILVDTRNLGEQAEQEFMAYTPLDEKLTPFSDTVRRYFQTWIMGRHAGTPTTEKFMEEQTDFLQMIRDHIITSFHFERDDLDYAPFDGKGGIGKMHQLFGDQMNSLIDELNRELVA